MKRTAVVSVAILFGLLVAGCSAAGNASDYYSQPEAPGGDIASDGEVETGARAAEQDSSRSEIVTGHMTVTAEEPLDTASEAIRLVEAVGGRVDGRREYAPVDGDKGSATLVLRIPSEAVDSTVDKLKELGEVEELALEASDVTAQVNDIDARVKALQASVDRLTVLLATAGDVEVLIQIESSLSQRQQELESMLTQQRSIGDQVSLATLTLSLISEADAPVDPPETFLTGLETGWSSFVAFVSGAVVLFGVLLPWLVFFALITAAILVIVRLARRAKITS